MASRTRRSSGAVGEGAVGRAEEVVGLAVLVEEPGHLARVAHEVARELRGDHEVDRRRRLVSRHLEEPPGQGLAHELETAGSRGRERSPRRPGSRGGRGCRAARAPGSRRPRSRTGPARRRRGPSSSAAETLLETDEAARAGPGGRARRPSRPRSASERTRSIRFTRSWTWATSSSCRIMWRSSISPRWRPHVAEHLRRSGDGWRRSGRRRSRGSRCRAAPASR